MPAKATKWSWRRQTLRPGFSPSQTLDHHSFGNLTQCGARSLGRLQTALKAVEPDKNIHQSLFHDHP